MQLELRHWLAILVTWVLLVNHWARDCIGALEIPLESNSTGYGLTPRQYNSLSSIYFLPNALVPIIAGVISQRNGGAATFVGFLRVLMLGNVLVAAGAIVADSIKIVPAHSDVPYGLTLAGRALMGIAYEAVDVVGPVGLLAPRFTTEWALVVGLINGFNRAGSVLGFLLGPALLHSHGLAAAILVPSVLGMTALGAGMICKSIDRRLRRSEGRTSIEGIAAAAEVQAAPDEPLDEPSVVVDAVPMRVAPMDVDTMACAPATGSAEPAVNVISIARSRSGSRSLVHFPRVTIADMLGGVHPRTLRRDLTPAFWLYLLGSGCAYGGMVPFWFIGSKHMTVKWGLPISDADAIMLLPEGLIALIAPTISAVMHYRRWDLPTRHAVCAVCQALSAMALLLLAWLPANSSAPLPLVLLLGVGYGCTQSLIWASLTIVAPVHLLNLVGGLVGSAVNILPTLLPAVALMGVNSSVDVSILAAVGLAGTLSFAAAARRARSDGASEEEETANRRVADGEPGRAGGIAGAKRGAASAARGDDRSMRSGLVRNASTQEAEWDMAPVIPA